MKKRGRRLLAWGAGVGGATLLFWRLGGGLFPLSLAAPQLGADSGSVGKIDKL